MKPAPGLTGLIVGLPTAAASEVALAGRKAATLAQLALAGFSVPDGFVVTTDAFDLFLSASRIFDPITETAVLGAVVPDEVRQAIGRGMEELGPVPVAVRSSGVAEDTESASSAGQYETILGVEGLDQITDAVRRCWASVFSERASRYQGPQTTQPTMAVLIQRMVPATAAGVAFTANPLTGMRNETVVSAIKGTGDRLVSGAVIPDEWSILGGRARVRRNSGASITSKQAVEIAALARRVESWAGVPQDIEWALEGDHLWLLQARPITALPEPVEWAPSFDGTWTRNFRLGEWITDPLTPLFDTWVLAKLEAGFAAFYASNITAGIESPPPHHLNVNGWYFGSLNFLPRGFAPKALAVAKLAATVVTQPRRVAMIMPFTARFGVELFLADWRHRLLPQYRELTRAASERVETEMPEELPALIEGLASGAGEYFASVTLVGGFAWKAELPLASFWKKHLASEIEGSHQVLLGGLSATPGWYPHAVGCLDLVHPPLGEPEPKPESAGAGQSKVAERRQTTEMAARRHLAGTRHEKRFERLLETAQRFAVIREEQVASFTLPWPVLRRAVLRLGEHLQKLGVTSTADDVFFLTHSELSDALASRETNSFDCAVASRRTAWERHRRLTPPLFLGSPSPFIRAMFATAERARMGAVPEESIRGQPASPGKVEAIARVILSLEDAGRLGAGEILITTATTPAWTPLFLRASGVVTDLGSVVAHASLVAREYGIPAVVGTGDATSRIADGARVLVDGYAGYVQVR